MAVDRKAALKAAKKGMSEREIAALFGVSQPVIHRHLVRARAEEAEELAALPLDARIALDDGPTPSDAPAGTQRPPSSGPSSLPPITPDVLARLMDDDWSDLPEGMEIPVHWQNVLLRQAKIEADRAKGIAHKTCLTLEEHEDVMRGAIEHIMDAFHAGFNCRNDPAAQAVYDAVREREIPWWESLFGDPAAATRSSG